MTERIRKERAVELAIEGHRFSDLRRWGIAKEVLSGRPALSIYGETQYTHSFTDSSDERKLALFSLDALLHDTRTDNSMAFFSYMKNKPSCIPVTRIIPLI